MLTTSAIIATYNGERFIEEQLYSLQQQSKKIDEVIILDDGSRDRTVDIIKQFISKYDLRNWSLYINKPNIGWRQNFIKGLQMCTGDIIFTCDQDDIWHPNKVAAITDAMFQDPKIQVLVSDYNEIVESGGVSEQPAIIKSVATDNNLVDYVPLNADNFFLKRPGCVFAIRKTFLPKTLLYISSFITPVHDLSMWGSSILSNGLYYYKEALIDWRKHGKSSIKTEEGKDNSSHYQLRINKLERRIQRINAGIAFLSQIEANETKKKILIPLLQECKMRVCVLKKKKVRLVLNSFFKYQHKIYFIADLYQIFKYRF